MEFDIHTAIEIVELSYIDKAFVRYKLTKKLLNDHIEMKSIVKHRMACIWMGFLVEVIGLNFSLKSNICRKRHWERLVTEICSVVETVHYRR